MTQLRKIRLIDSHTGGEPTRLVVSGAPGLVFSARVEPGSKLQSIRNWCVSEVTGGEQ